LLGRTARRNRSLHAVNEPAQLLAKLLAVGFRAPRNEEFFTCRRLCKGFVKLTLPLIMPIAINPENVRNTTFDTIVIGGGIIGVCIALSLQQAGQQVLLIERQAIAAGASGGNAGHIGSEQIAPIASLGIVKDLPTMLLDPLGPVRIDFRYWAQLMPWFIRLLWQLRRQPYQASCRALQQINRQALPAWEQLLKRENLSHLLRLNGSYAVAATAKGIQLLQDQQRQLAAADIPVQWLNQADLHVRLPLLTDNHRGGLFYPTTAHVICPKSVCEALHARFVAAGGLTHFATVNHIGESDKHVDIRIDNDDKPLHSRQAIIATGINSIDLVKQSSGIRVPLKDERGYHLMTQIPENGEHGLLDAP
ncbi:MAG: hypothetical protein CR977_04070, partial [Gammaproteobacteria bacterium]